jgi:hypothetical protein
MTTTNETKRDAAYFHRLLMLCVEKQDRGLITRGEGGADLRVLWDRICEAGVEGGVMAIIRAKHGFPALTTEAK